MSYFSPQAVGCRAASRQHARRWTYDCETRGRETHCHLNALQPHRATLALVPLSFCSTFVCATYPPIPLHRNTMLWGGRFSALAGYDDEMDYVFNAAVQRVPLQGQPRAHHRPLL